MPASVWTWIWSVGVIFVAGIIRGYGGFGFSMMAAAGLTLVMPPVAIIPSILILEVAASALLIARVWRDIQWPAIGWLSAGVLVGTPAGTWLLKIIPPAPMTVAISAVIILLALVMRREASSPRRPGRWWTLGAGTVSGVLNGAAAIGGPPAILFFFSTAAGVAASRASLIAFFMGTDVIAAFSCAAMGLMDGSVLKLAAALMLPTAAGVLLGHRVFDSTPTERFRRRVLLLLAILSTLTMTRALISVLFH